MILNLLQLAMNFLPEYKAKIEVCRLLNGFEYEYKQKNIHKKNKA